MSGRGRCVAEGPGCGHSSDGAAGDGSLPIGVRSGERAKADGALPRAGSGVIGWPHPSEPDEPDLFPCMGGGPGIQAGGGHAALLHPPDAIARQGTPLTDEDRGFAKSCSPTQCPLKSPDFRLPLRNLLTKARDQVKVRRVCAEISLLLRWICRQCAVRRTPATATAC